MFICLMFIYINGHDYNQCIETTNRMYKMYLSINKNTTRFIGRDEWNAPTVVYKTSTFD